MKATELRIGNLIYWDIPQKLNRPHEVVGIINDRVQTIPISLGDTMDVYKPIPLTEEWLMKFGFKEGDYGHYWLGEFFLYFKKAKNCYGLVTLSNLYPDIKYIHQLQNLYFALTGEELELIKND